MHSTHKHNFSCLCFSPLCFGRLNSGLSNHRELHGAIFKRAARPSGRTHRALIAVTIILHVCVDSQSWLAGGGNSTSGFWCCHSVHDLFLIIFPKLSSPSSRQLKLIKLSYPVGELSGKSGLAVLHFLVQKPPMYEGHMVWPRGTACFLSVAFLLHFIILLLSFPGQMYQSMMKQRKLNEFLLTVTKYVTLKSLPITCACCAKFIFWRCKPDDVFSLHYRSIFQDIVSMDTVIMKIMVSCQKVSSDWNRE